MGKELSGMRRKGIASMAAKKHGCGTQGATPRSDTLTRWMRWGGGGRNMNWVPEVEQEQPDLRGPAVVIVGGLQAGFRAYGPFENIEVAVEWSESLIAPGAVSVFLLEQT